MPMSVNMLNFLGYAKEEGGSVEAGLAVALAYPFGVASMLKSGLIEPERRSHMTYEDALKVGFILPGFPYGESFDCYSLTLLGEAVGKVGEEARKTPGGYGDKVRWAPFLKEADTIIKVGGNADR